MRLSCTSKLSVFEILHRICNVNSEVKPELKKKKPPICGCCNVKVVGFVVQKTSHIEKFNICNVKMIILYSIRFSMQLQPRYHLQEATTHSVTNMETQQRQTIKTKTQIYVILLHLDNKLQLKGKSRILFKNSHNPEILFKICISGPILTTKIQMCISGSMYHRNEV